VRIGIGANKRIIVGKKRDAGRNGIGIRIIGTVVLYPLLGTEHQIAYG